MSKTAVSYGNMTYSNNGNNAFTDVGNALNTIHSKTVKFYVTAANNSMDFQILGSLNGGNSYPIAATSSITVAAGANNSQTLTTPFTNLKIQGKPTTGGQNGVLTVQWLAATF